VGETLGKEAFLESLIVQNGLYAKERATMPMANVASMMKQHLQAKEIPSPRGATCTLQFDYPDRYKAAAVLRDIVAHIETTHPEVQELDAASLPEEAFAPNRLLLVLGALLAGLLLGTAVMALRHRRAPALAA
jgi:hypothetical protein